MADIGMRRVFVPGTQRFFFTRTPLPTRDHDPRRRRLLVVPTTASSVGTGSRYFTTTTNNTDTAVAATAVTTVAVPRDRRRTGEEVTTVVVVGRGLSVRVKTIVPGASVRGLRSPRDVRLPVRGVCVTVRVCVCVR